MKLQYPFKKVQKPIALTAGEPAGIGPDLLVKLAQQKSDLPFVAVCDPDLLSERAALLKMPLNIKVWRSGSAMPRRKTGDIPVIPVKTDTKVHAGILDKTNASYVLRTLRVAADGCLSRKFSAMVTGPIQKSVICDAGFLFSGHTEFLADHSRTPRVVMMLATEGLRVALATTHLPLKNVPAAITQKSLTATLKILLADLRHKFAVQQPRILVCGLNPHAGEGGHLGREEIDIIAPTIARFRALGEDMTGPLPADTLFTPPILKNADAVLAMYHDQGLPVLKYAGFGQAVNITLGLPFIRTSVDHGTALSLAGTGKAKAGSLMAALQYADRLVQQNPTAKNAQHPLKTKSK